VAEVLVVVQCSVLVVTGGCTGVWWCEGGMYRVVGSFVCGGSSGPVVSAGHAGVDVGASAGLEVVDGFCCLGGVLVWRLEMLVRLWRPGSELDGAVGAIACQWGYVTG